MEKQFFCARCGAKVTISGNLVEPCTICASLATTLAHLRGFCSGLSAGVDFTAERMASEISDAEDQLDSSISRE